jgi:hypothetical protein
MPKDGPDELADTAVSSSAAEKQNFWYVEKKNKSTFLTILQINSWKVDAD